MEMRCSDYLGNVYAQSDYESDINILEKVYGVYVDDEEIEPLQSKQEFAKLLLEIERGEVCCPFIQPDLVAC